MVTGDITCVLVSITQWCATVTVKTEGSVHHRMSANVWRGGRDHRARQVRVCVVGSQRDQSLLTKSIICVCAASWWHLAVVEPLSVHFSFRSGGSEKTPAIIPA